MNLITLATFLFVAITFIDSLHATREEQTTSVDGKVNVVTKGDDYPYSTCNGLDEWRFNKCQFTRFVAWHVNGKKGISFKNGYKGGPWSRANTWSTAAKQTGILVDSTPEMGSIAQTNAGVYGHVAWVVAVNGDQVTTEEYNALVKQGYGKRTMNKGAFRYIHV